VLLKRYARCCWAFHHRRSDRALRPWSHHGFGLRNEKGSA